MTRTLRRVAFPFRLLLLSSPIVWALSAPAGCTGEVQGEIPNEEVIDPDVGDTPVEDGVDAGAGASAGAAAPLPTRDEWEPGPLPTCEDVDQRLVDDLGIIIKPGTLAFGGLAPTNIGCEGRIKVYRMFVAPFRYAGYRRRLDSTTTPVTMHLYRSDDSRAGWCSGYVPNARAIQIRDLARCLRDVTDVEDRHFRSTAMFLIHESGHVISGRNDGLKAMFRDADLVARDPQCYDDGFLKTYYYRSGVNRVSESFAEAVALFIGRSKVGAHATIRDFETECPHTYEWIRANVFDWSP